MSLPVFFRPEAEAEVAEAYAWYERQRTGLGEDFLAALEEVLERARVNPKVYAEAHRDLRRGLTRRFPYGVFYRVEEDRIVVVAVFHGRRDPRVWQERA